MQIKRHILGSTLVEYLINDKKSVSLRIVPKSMEKELKSPWEKELKHFDPRAKYQNSFFFGNLSYYHVKGENQSFPGYTMKSNKGMIFESQDILEDDNSKTVVTVLKNDKGYKICHKLIYKEGLKGFIVNTTFINESADDVYLDMLSSFALDNLSPFQNDDAPNKYKFHRFYGGWALEGKHICNTIEELSLEKSWAGFNCNNEKFASLGSYPVKRYFPTAVFEDSEHSVFWAVQLAHNATWQMELSRNGDTLSFTGGLGDRDLCGWRKLLKSGEEFTSPDSYIAVVCGDIYDACAAVVDMQKTAYREYGEQGIGVCFNEYCATWGRPTQGKMLDFCNELKDFGIKYLVIDAGWCKEGCEQDSNGEWGIDKNIFPDMKEMNRIIRENGMIPGIWFEFEVTTKGSLMFEPEYDYMHLTKDNEVLKSGGARSYWDFRRQDVRDYLYEKVIKMLKDNDFGYIKVDYNNNIGIGVDGAESEAEGLREHLSCVRDFFKKIKEEIPDIIIENCASGGHRLEPSMMGVSGVSSFSDAHECVEVPYVAANLHNLMLPAQELIWAVLHDDDDDNRMYYTLSAAFFGRMCLSGDIPRLSEHQKDILRKSLDFYKKLEDVIVNGKTKIYGNRGVNMRYPEGTQIAVRKTDKEVLVICHAFENAGGCFDINSENLELVDKFGVDNISVSDGKIIVDKMDDFTACAALFRIK